MLVNLRSMHRAVNREPSNQQGERNELEVEAERVRAELLTSRMTQRLQVPCGAPVCADEIRKSAS